MNFRSGIPPTRQRDFGTNGDVHRFSDRQVLSALLTLLLAGVLLGACGGGDNGNGDDAAEIDTELASQGDEYFAQFGCDTCHSVSGSEGTGPSLDGLFGSDVELEGGETVTADEEYLRTSILQPSEPVVAGYSGQAMAATISGDMSEIEQGDTVDALVEYIKILE